MKKEGSRQGDDVASGQVVGTKKQNELQGESRIKLQESCEKVF